MARKRHARQGALHAFEFVEGWGMTVGAHARVLRPRSVEELAQCFEQARRDGVTLGPRGGGISYGDASVNESGHTLDLSRMNRIRDFDAQSGVITLESGVTIEQLWKHILPLGFWPRVVSGTMFPTVGGAAAMNIHGKNNFAVGTIGDAIVEFDLLLANGELRKCSRSENADLFHAAIGGLGMLGVFTRIVLETKRVYSGDLRVRAISSRNLAEMMAYMDAHRGDADYLVGWVDCFPSGDALGRGVVHHANYLHEGEDPDPATTLSIAHQELPSSILGFPKTELWRILAWFNNDPGMRLINAAKFHSGRVEAHAESHLQSHAGFAFLLDYVPNWKWAYGRERVHQGLIQYQSFLPKETAHAVYSEMLDRNQRAGFLPYLGVFKRHRPDPFWLTHAVDGWSLSFDFKVTAENRERLWKHCAGLTEVVLAGGGRFYFAKDLVLGAKDPERFYPREKLAAFKALKRELDPEGLFQTNLWRRAFEPGARALQSPIEA